MNVATLAATEVAFDKYRKDMNISDDMIKELRGDVEIISSYPWTDQEIYGLHQAAETIFDKPSLAEVENFGRGDLYMQRFHDTAVELYWMVHAISTLENIEQ